MDTLKDKRVTTRKKHYCHGCLRDFKAGSELRNIISVDGGEISSVYWCDVCEITLNENKQFSDAVDGYFEGEIKEKYPEEWEKTRKEIEG